MEHNDYFWDCITEEIDIYKKAYSILGISIDSSKKEIKRAYRKLAKKYHPDHNSNTKESHKLFNIVNQSYNLIIHNIQPDISLFRDIYSKDLIQEEKLNNSWGRYLWYQDRFFLYENRNKPKKQKIRRTCI